MWSRAYAHLSTWCTNWHCICDWACKNRACGHMNFAYFFNLSELITLYPNILWQWKFQHLVQIYLALWCRLQNENILFHYWDMTFRETGCSLCPHAIFLQAWSHIMLCLTVILGFLRSSGFWVIIAYHPDFQHGPSAYFDISSIIS